MIGSYISDTFKVCDTFERKKFQIMFSNLCKNRHLKRLNNNWYHIFNQSSL